MKEFPAPVLSSGRRHAAAAALLLILVVISFSPVFHHGFVNWDDEAYVTENPRIKEMTADSFGGVLTSLERAQYKPVTFFGFAAQYRFFRLRPGGYHAVSLGLHAFTTLLVFGLFLLLGREPFVAWGAAALFGIHPLRVESVAWVTEQKDLLYGFFLLAALIAYVLYRQKGRRLPYYLSLVFFCLSLLAKPMAVMFPVILTGVDAVFFRRRWRSSWTDKVPFIVLSAAVILINVLALQWLGLSHALSFSFADPWHRLAFYISKIFWPAPLSCFYPGGAERAPEFMMRASVLLGVGAFMARQRRRTAEFFFGLLFVAMMLTPVLFSKGVFAVADRYVYVAALGVFYAVLELSATLKRRVGVLFAMGIVLAALSLLTFQRCAVWRDGIALWEDVLATYPHASLAHLNAASAYYAAGDDEGARRHAQAVLASDPRSWDSWLVLGNVAFRQKRYADAKKSYEAALSLNPSSCGACNGLGLVAQMRGREGEREAIGWFQRAVQLNPSSFQSLVNGAGAYLRAGEKKEALRWLQRAMALRGDDVATLQNISLLLFEEGRFVECLDILKRLMVLRPGDARVYANTGAVLIRLGLDEEARPLFEAARKLDPSFNQGPA